MVIGATVAVELTRHIMQIPRLTEQEHDILQKLAEHGPSRMIASPMRGRLALYKLINETPKRWAITQDGKEAIVRPPMKASPAESPTAEDPGRVGRSRISGKRLPNRRKSPFS
jgi:hypothetical protein